MKETVKIVVLLFVAAIIGSNVLPYVIPVVTAGLSHITGGGLVIALIAYYIYSKERKRADRAKWSETLRSHFKKKESKEESAE